jgi:hypothetical protein
VDPAGESWDVAGLFVADASLFPSSSGANPMVTVMALAFIVAHNIVGRLEQGGSGARQAAAAAAAHPSVKVPVAGVAGAAGVGAAEGKEGGGAQQRKLRKASVQVLYDE